MIFWHKKKCKGQPTPRPIGSVCGVLRFGYGRDCDRFMIGQVLGSRFDARRDMFVYAVKFPDNGVEAVLECDAFDVAIGEEVE